MGFGFSTTAYFYGSIIHFATGAVRTPTLEIRAYGFIPTTEADINNLDDLNDLQNIVADKRNAKRKREKRNRRDRHYNKLFIKIALKNHLENDDEKEVIS